MKKIALIDGYGFVFRAYHSLPPLTRNDGTPTNAVFGFTNMLIKLLAGLDVSHIAVVFDSGSKTFRNDIYSDYKANRPPCPEDLKPQFPLIRQSAEALNLAILEKVGFEADDIIATMAKKYSNQGHQVLIVSSDKDLMQLVDDRVLMYDAMKNKVIGAAEVKEKFFVEPNKVLDVLSLIGDSSDNVPGVKGIGPKTAAELIEQFGNLENIFKNLDQIKQEKRRQMLLDGEEKAYLSKKLISLAEDVETNTTLEDLEIKEIDPEKLISFLEEQGFRSLVVKVRNEFKINSSSSTKSRSESSNSVANNLENNAANSDNFSAKNSNSLLANKNFSEVKILRLTELQDCQNLINAARQNGYLVLDQEDDIVTVATFKHSQAIEEVFYYKLNDDNSGNNSTGSSFKTIKENENSGDLFAELSAEFSDEKTQENDQNNSAISVQNGAYFFAELEKILVDDSVKKILFDAKRLLKKHRIKPFEDVLLINHLASSSVKHSLYDLAKLNLSDNIEELGFGKIFEEIEKQKYPQAFEDEATKIFFCCYKNFAISQIYRIFENEIFAKKLNNAYYNFELPMLDLLAEMENNGVKIDVEKLADLSCELGQKINQLTSEIYTLAGCEFNIASPKQLGEVLFEKMAINSKKKSKKTGELSTNAKVLEELEEEYEIAGKILEFRKFSKLKNTYTDSLPKEINPKTLRIHSNFSTCSTITGRLSSSNPNLQNIPIKSLEGKKIRQSFIAAKDHLLISADYSQVELRVIAEVAKIDSLITAFKENKDIHRITAAQVFNVSIDEVTDEMRNKAKAINFGIIYGISGFGLAKQLKISRQEAGDYIKKYLATYPGIEEFMKSTIEKAREFGFVETISGRKCIIKDIANKNPILRNEAERLSINAPIQGSAADIVKKAMIKLRQKFQEEKISAKIILQIHDELLIEAKENEAEKIAEITKKVMENAMTLSVPLKVDVSIGKFWK